MKVRGAVCHEVGAGWSVEDLELEAPKENEVLVRVMASGLCHSDEHLLTGDLPSVYPVVGGHEGSGIVEAVGPGVTRVKPGDHVATAFIPGCGTCEWCARGWQFICDSGADVYEGKMLDGTPRFHLSSGEGVGAMQRLGTFSNYLVTHETQCIKIDDDLPFAEAALVACGVTTGWGSVVYAGGAQPGDVVLVLGAGGVGMNAVQGAGHAGARLVVVVDPVKLKRDVAETMGATHTFSSLADALPLVHQETNGQGADVVIITIGRVEPQHVSDAFDATRKMGTCVLVGVGENDALVPLKLIQMQAYAKVLRGTLFGNSSPTRDIPRLLSYYKAGKLKLSELITNTYKLEEVNQAYEDLRNGVNVRGVILHEH
jgi:S-(hydroxymethyl)glutathione dehydrogenase/alcohol dehydrogenase